MKANFVHTYWASGERVDKPGASFLPTHQLLKNLGAWSEHLRHTEFILILWVNQAVADELNDIKNSHIIYKDISQIYRTLARQGKEITLFQEFMQEIGVNYYSKECLYYWKMANRYHTDYCLPINTIVINIDTCFDNLTERNINFASLLKLYRDLNTYRLFAIAKDYVVVFLLSWIGGFYFDLDFKPSSTKKFFSNVDEVISLMRFYHLPLEKVYPLVKFFAINNSKCDFDVGMQFCLKPTTLIEKYKSPILYQKFSYAMKPDSASTEKEKLKKAHEFYDKYIKRADAVTLHFFNRSLKESASEIIKKMSFEQKKYWLTLHKQGPTPLRHELDKKYPQGLRATFYRREILSARYMSKLIKELGNQPGIFIYGHFRKQDCLGDSKLQQVRDAYINFISIILIINFLNYS